MGFYLIRLWPASDEETEGKVIYPFDFMKRVAEEINKSEVAIIDDKSHTIGHSVIGGATLKGASIFLDVEIEDGNDAILNDPAYTFSPHINIDADNPDDALDTQPNGVKSVKSNVTFTVKNIDLYK